MAAARATLRQSVLRALPRRALSSDAPERLLSRQLPAFLSKLRGAGAPRDTPLAR
jgi:hypothetical protein